MADIDHPPSELGARPVQGYDTVVDAPRSELAEASVIHGAPPVAEEIHMPEPSLIPIINAAGVTIALLGVTSSIWLVVAGMLIILVTTAMWVRDTRREIASFPAAHHDHH